MFCRRAVARLRDEGLLKDGAPVTFVHQGSPAQAARFFETMEVPHARNVSDKKRRLYKALGLQTLGLSALFDTRMIKAGKVAWEEGFRQGRTIGSAAQLHGLALVTDGTLTEVRRAEHAGEELDHEVISTCVTEACQL